VLGHRTGGVGAEPAAGVLLAFVVGDSLAEALARGCAAAVA
jgi:hypothetical protein